jgi:2-polyprenyl-6-methoxyphenol hydroxylase-like FAD-dependent oxidoreductase
MSRRYDAIVVGARCAGSPVAMLLAREGHRVLLLDRANFPSDTVSTHVVHPLGVAALERWGLLERLIATGCPPIHTYAFDFGPFTLAGNPGIEDSPVSYCPRRTILDELLVTGAREAGVEVREAFTVDSLVFEDGVVTGIQGHAADGEIVKEHARLVIGADGRRSLVAEAVQAEKYHEKPALMSCCFTYWSGLPMEGRFETYIRDRRGFAAAPTHDGLTMIVTGWPHAEDAANRKDSEGNHLRTIELVPEFAKRLGNAKRVGRLSGAGVPNFFRKPYGPGWALVGDAGYNKDPITAQGITDAFRDAERCASAIHESFSGKRSFDDAMADYQRTRDERALPMYEFTTQLATLEPPPRETLQLFGAIHGNREAMDDFVKMNAGTISPAQFFAPDNLGAIMAAAANAPS